jgi:sec-independent protein translocase protein TatB
MFGVSSFELLVIILIALVVLGPERLPKAIRMVTRLLSELRRVSTDLQRTINVEAYLQEQNSRPRQPAGKVKAPEASGDLSPGGKAASPEETGSADAAEAAAPLQAAGEEKTLPALSEEDPQTAEKAPEVRA